MFSKRKNKRIALVYSEYRQGIRIADMQIKRGDFDTDLMRISFLIDMRRYGDISPRYKAFKTRVYKYIVKNWEGNQDRGN